MVCGQWYIEKKRKKGKVDHLVIYFKRRRHKMKQKRIYIGENERRKVN